MIFFWITIWWHLKIPTVKSVLGDSQVILQFRFPRGSSFLSQLYLSPPPLLFGDCYFWNGCPRNRNPNEQWYSNWDYNQNYRRKYISVKDWSYLISGLTLVISGMVNNRKLPAIASTYHFHQIIYLNKIKCNPVQMIDTDIGIT